jgi:hypothetical protein
MPQEASRKIWPMSGIPSERNDPKRGVGSFSTGKPSGGLNPGLDAPLSREGILRPPTFSGSGSELVSPSVDVLEFDSELVGAFLRQMAEEEA